MAICESIVQVLEQQATEKDFSRVKTVWLEIGELAGVELHALRFSFDAATRGTLAESARLEIVTSAGTAWCMPCGKTVRIARKYEGCPECGGYQLQITGGEEMRIKELEVD